MATAIGARTAREASDVKASTTTAVLTVREPMDHGTSTMASFLWCGGGKQIQPCFGE